MKPVDVVSGIAIPFGRDNVDTDLIIPGRWLKTVTRSGLGNGAFESLRAEPDNLFDTPRNHAAPILIAGSNFGCGSSREHAPWALMDFGIRVIVATSFADIFASNALKNGLLLVTLSKTQIVELLDQATQSEMTVDLRHQTISMGSMIYRFSIDDFQKECLLSGRDQISIIEDYRLQICDFFEK